MATDILGTEIDVGNFVIFRTPHYSGICIGRAIALTPKKVRIEYINDWNYSNGRREYILVDHGSVCVMNGEDVTAYALRNQL